jgi:hypothetical protein
LLPPQDRQLHRWRRQPAAKCIMAPSTRSVKLSKPVSSSTCLNTSRPCLSKLPRAVCCWANQGHVDDQDHAKQAWLSLLATHIKEMHVRLGIWLKTRNRLNTYNKHKKSTSMLLHQPHGAAQVHTLAKEVAV